MEILFTPLNRHVKQGAPTASAGTDRSDAKFFIEYFCKI